MSRRRLRMLYTSSSDEEEEPQQQQPQQNQNQLHRQQDDDEVFEDVEQEQPEIPSQNPIPNIETVTLSSSNPTVSEPAPVEISDEDFIDVSDNLSPPSPPASVVSSTPVTGSFVASNCPVNDCLRKLGLNLRREWLDSCKLGFENTVPGFSSYDSESKAKLCFGQFLYSDLNYTGAGVLPENVHDMHLVDLAGPFVLQVDEVINISCPLRERYKNAPPGLKRCLKLSMTDGVQRVFGMEYRPIPNKILEALSPAGFKVVIRNVHVRRGLLMLVPEVLEVLGGSVDGLEEARQRLVHELNKPPRGKRSRTGVVPPLSTRATLAAWAQNGVSNDPLPLNGANQIPWNTTNSTVHGPSQVYENVQGTGTTSRPTQDLPTVRDTTELSTYGETNQHSTSRENVQRTTYRDSSQRSTYRETSPSSTFTETAELATTRETRDRPHGRENSDLNSHSTTVVENEDAHMVDHVEHPFILSGGMEVPFTYLASLSAKWAALQGTEPFVRGKIKCFLTGVKGFQYKHQSTFELRVHIDDGSLISEILIHHNVVQKRIGYSPQEVTTALSSSDRKIVSDMKETLKHFQIFLINFEGTMFVEMNAASPVPVALEVNEGYPAVDTWLLLKRVKSLTSSPLCQNDQSNVINLSP